MNRRTTALALPATLVAALLLSGCGGGTGSTESHSPAPATSAPSERANESSSSSTDLRNHTPGVTPREAVATAHESHPGDLQSLELTTTRSGVVYRVELATAENEADVVVDATDGVLLDSRIERSDSFDPADPAISLSDVIDAQDAMQSANTIIDGPVESWTLTHSDGRLVYQVDFEGKDREIDVDAFTGDVVEIDD